MNKFFKNILMIGASAMLLASCTGNFEDLNSNPKRSDKIDPNLIFPYVTWAACDGYHEYNEIGLGLGAGIWSQYLASDCSPDRNNYVESWCTGGIWTPYYMGVCKNVIEVSKVMDDKPSCTVEFQLMRIMKAMAMSKITDAFGDAPYFEAGTGNPKPKFDSQKDIYYDIFKELTEVVDILKSNPQHQEDIASSDLIYEGDVQKWIKFANSLRLRYAIRLSFIDPEKAKAEGEAALAAGVMTDVDDEALLQTNVENWNSLGFPLHPYMFFEEFCVSNTFVDYMENYANVADPREPLYIGKTETYVESGKGPEFRGAVTGLAYADWHSDGSPYYPDYSNIDGLMFNPGWNSKGESHEARADHRMFVMHYSEVCFLKAEAALRGWAGAGVASTNYTNGIKASLAECRKGVDAKLYTTANDEAYLSSPKVAWNEGNTFEGKLEQIITQKWIANFLLCHEGWAEFRRTGYPNLKTAVVNDNSDLQAGEFLKKVRYPDAEKRNDTNQNFSILNNNQGDGSNVRVWWDTKRYK